MADTRSRYFLYASIVMLAIVLTGFTPTFYLRPFFGRIDEPTGSMSLPWHLIFHGLSMTAWYVLFVVQAYLVNSQRTALHRKLGVAGLVAAACVVISGTLVLLLVRIRRLPEGVDSLPPVLPGQGGVPIFQTYSFFFFVTFIFLAVLYRKRSFLHKRLMLVSSVLVLAAAFADQRGFRLVHEMLPEFISLRHVTESLILLSLLWHDWTAHRKIYAVTIIGAIIAGPARYLVVNTLVNSEIGIRYVEWLTSLLQNAG